MRNNRLLIFLALLFVALFSYWTFEQIKFYREKDGSFSFKNLPDTLSTFTEGENNETSPTPNTSETLETDKPEMPKEQYQGETVFGQWVANDYKEGDIQKGTYTVKSGDTLWEIAEAVYGDGTQWVNILNANYANVGYLPNGQQALIYTGQVINIP